MVTHDRVVQGWRRWLAFALGLALVGCAGHSGRDSSDLTASGDGELLLMVTVDWEGDDLRDENIDAMVALRERFGELPLVQFLNAAYFTKPGADADQVRARIAATIREHDELGLHVHGWKRLFEAAGVAFRNQPTFWGTSVPSYACSVDCGHEVPISEYDASELSQVFRFSTGVLDDNGFGRASSFRAGGWMAAPNVRSALFAEGFAVDSSAVPAHFLQGEIGDLPLHHWVSTLWEGIDADSQPYELDGLTEIPDNGALADYVTSEEMVGVYQQAKARLRESPKQDQVVNIGFHQETAAKYLPRVTEALAIILADARDAELPLRLTTMTTRSE